MPPQARSMTNQVLASLVAGAEDSPRAKCGKCGTQSMLTGRALDGTTPRMADELTSCVSGRARWATHAVGPPPLACPAVVIPCNQLLNAYLPMQMRHLHRHRHGHKDTRTMRPQAAIQHRLLHAPRPPPCSTRRATHPTNKQPRP